LSEEYDLKKSEKGIGQLYPILKSKDGKTIDGFHREAANPNWKSVMLPEIDTEEKLLIARCVANWHRRKVKESEKEEWINRLARIYKKQGYKISDKFPFENEIKQRIIEVTGLKHDTVESYLVNEYKQQQRRPKESYQPQIPASQRIEKNLGSEVVERHREEVLAEEKPRIEQQVKAKLLKSPEFQREVIREISKPQIVKASEPCPSGVCELPSRIDAGKPIDVRAESLVKFWQNNPKCLCKKCEHYEKCGVFR